MKRSAIATRRTVDPSVLNVASTGPNGSRALRRSGLGMAVTPGKVDTDVTTRSLETMARVGNKATIQTYRRNRRSRVSRGRPSGRRTTTAAARTTPTADAVWLTQIAAHIH